MFSVTCICTTGCFVGAYQCCNVYYSITEKGDTGEIAIGQEKRKKKRKIGMLVLHVSSKLQYLKVEHSLDEIHCQSCVFPRFLQISV